MTLSSSVNVEVFSLSIVKNIKTNIVALELEQLESLTIQVEAYDEFWNVSHYLILLEWIPLDVATSVTWQWRVGVRNT